MMWHRRETRRKRRKQTPACSPQEVPSLLDNPAGPPSFGLFERRLLTSSQIRVLLTTLNSKALDPGLNPAGVTCVAFSA